MAISSAKSRYPGSSCPGASHGGTTCPGAICGLCLATDVDLKHTSLGERNSELGNRHWNVNRGSTWQHEIWGFLRILGNWKDISWTLALTLWKIFSSCHSAVCFFIGTGWMICQLVTATYCNYVESPRNRTCINKSNKCETRILSPLILLRPILWIEFVLTPHLCEWTILKILKHSTSNKKNIKRVCVCIYTYIILNSIKFRHYIIYIYIIYIHDNSILQWFTQSLATPSPTPRLGIQSVAAVFGQGTSCALWLSRKGAGAPVDGPVVSRLDVWVRTRYIIYIYILCIYRQCIKIYIEVFVYYTCDIYMW